MQRGGIDLFLPFWLVILTSMAKLPLYSLPAFRTVAELQNLRAAAEVARAAETGMIIVVVDQLEELFTLSACTDEREQFAAAIAQAIAAVALVGIAALVLGAGAKAMKSGAKTGKAA